MSVGIPHKRMNIEVINIEPADYLVQKQMSSIFLLVYASYAKLIEQLWRFAISGIVC